MKKGSLTFISLRGKSLILDSLVSYQRNQRDIAYNDV